MSAATFARMKRENSDLQQLGVADLLVRHLVGGVAVHPHDRVVRLAVEPVVLVGAECAGDLSRAPVGPSGHQRGDRGGRPAAVV